MASSLHHSKLCLQHYLSYDLLHVKSPSVLFLLEHLWLYLVPTWNNPPISRYPGVSCTQVPGPFPSFLLQAWKSLIWLCTVQVNSCGHALHTPWKELTRAAWEGLPSRDHQAPGLMFPRWITAGVEVRSLQFLASWQSWARTVFSLGVKKSWLNLQDLGGNKSLSLFLYWAV